MGSRMLGRTRENFERGVSHNALHEGIVREISEWPCAGGQPAYIVCVHTEFHEPHDCKYAKHSTVGSVGGCCVPILFINKMGRLEAPSQFRNRKEPCEVATSRQQQKERMHLPHSQQQHGTAHMCNTCSVWREREQYCMVQNGGEKPRVPAGVLRPLLSIFVRDSPRVKCSYGAPKAAASPNNVDCSCTNVDCSCTATRPRINLNTAGYDDNYFGRHTRLSRDPIKQL